MLNQRCLLLAVGAAVGGLASAAVLSIAAAHADDCDRGACALISGGHPTDVIYGGFRPLLADWQDNQPVNVEVTTPNGTFISGSYVVSEQDYESHLMDQAIYQYGDFTPSADNPTGIDSLGLAGTKVYDFWLGPFGTNAAGEPTYQFNNLNIFYGDGSHTEVTTLTGQFTNYLIGDGKATGDWVVYAGDPTPHLLWDSLPSSEFPTSYINDLLPNVLPPDAWFPLGNADLGLENVTNVVTELATIGGAASAADAASSLLS